MPLKIVPKPLTNGAWGYPQGKKRRVKPPVLLVIHQTGNVRADAIDEVRNANSPNGDGPTATFWLARSGATAYQTLDPVTQVPWTNGRLEAPNWDAPGMDKVKKLTDRGYNAQEAAFATVEVSTYKTIANSVSPAQERALIELLAHLSRLSGLPISPATVHVHSYYATKSRASCPVPAAKRKAFLARLIAGGNLALGLAAPAPTPLPTPVKPATNPKTAAREELKLALAKITALKWSAAKSRLWQRVAKLRKTITG